MRDVIFHAEAAEELIAAAEWYRIRRKGLADEFSDEFTKVLNFIQYFPESGPVILGDTRRMLLNRFPYAVVYLHDLQEIKVVAISHHSRRPGYWSKRKF